MNIATIDRLIRSLGEKFDVLLAAGVLSEKHELKSVFSESAFLNVSIQAGASLTFWAETKKLESIFLRLKKTTPSTVEYEGPLPPPYKHDMSQLDVHSIFGKPVEVGGPVRMPEPLGQTGGWESFLLDQDIYPGKQVVFQYTAEMKVSTLVFTLIDLARPFEYTKKADRHCPDVMALREEPGTVRGWGSGGLAAWFDDAMDEGARIPQLIADQLRWKEYSVFSEFEQAVWKTMALYPASSQDFFNHNLRRIQAGLAPVVLREDQVGKRKTLEFHHDMSYSGTEAVYQVDGISIMTPRSHIKIHQEDKHDEA
ncbi:DUF6392 family protein [Pseudomonas sp. GNP014]